MEAEGDTADPMPIKCTITEDGAGRVPRFVHLPSAAPASAAVSAPNTAVCAAVQRFLSNETPDKAPLETLKTLSDWKVVLELSSAWEASTGNEKTLVFGVRSLKSAVNAYESAVNAYKSAVEIHELRVRCGEGGGHPPPSIAEFSNTEFVKTMIEIHPFVFRDLSFAGFLRKLAKDAFGRNVFMASHFAKTLSSRSVRSNFFPSANDSLIETGTMKDIRDSPEDVTQLIGGASGSGKTNTAIGLASEMCFPVLMSMKDIEEKLSSDEEKKEKLSSGKKKKEKLPPSEDLIPTEPEERNRVVRELLVSMVENILDGAKTSALERLQNYKDAKNCIILPIVVDEVGETQKVVKAMAAIKASDVREALGLGLAVRVLLVAVGTGVGQRGTCWGSESSSFNIHIINDLKTNNAIFQKLLGENDLAVAPLTPIINSNARMAAVCATLLVEMTREFGPPPSINQSKANIPAVADGSGGFPNLRKSFDVTTIFLRASLRFKALNGLSVLKESEMATVMSSALRMYLFPFCDTSNANLIEVKYGLVVDMAFVAGPSPEEGLPWNCETMGGSERRIMVPQEGRFSLPYFAMPMLSSICNMPWVTRGGLDGSSLEEYWLSVSALAACAASNASLFSLMLKSGTLAPLCYHRSAKAMASLDPKNQSGLMIAGDELLEHKDFKLLVSDLQAEGVALGYKGAPSQYFSSFKDEVEKRIVDAFPSGVKEKDNAVSAIAAFRSPPKLPFADTMLFYNDRLFLFQTKHRVVDGADGKAHDDAGAADFSYHWTKISLIEELVKMGMPEAEVKVAKQNMKSTENAAKTATKKAADEAGDEATKKAADEAGDEAAKKAAEKALATREVVDDLKSLWKEHTGYTINVVEYCFVSPKGHIVPTGCPEVCRFLKTDGVTFMKFEPKRNHQQWLKLSSQNK